MIIPQGNNRVRIYVQISNGDGQDPSVETSQMKIQHMANKILSPYKVEWESVDWHSAYRIGQGISQRYSLANRIFIGGDACHTHSVSLSHLPCSFTVPKLTYSSPKPARV